MSIVSAKMLTKVYAGKIRAVDNLDLEIEAGQIFGFLGPNGAGKDHYAAHVSDAYPDR